MIRVGFDLLAFFKRPVSLSLNAYYSGHPLMLYREGDRQIPVMLRLPPSQRKTLDELANCDKIES